MIEMVSYLVPIHIAVRASHGTRTEVITVKKLSVGIGFGLVAGGLIWLTLGLLALGELYTVFRDQTQGAIMIDPRILSDQILDGVKLTLGGVFGLIFGNALVVFSSRRS